MIETMLARLALLLQGAWGLLAGHVGEVRWTFAPGGRWLLAGGAILAAVLAGLCYWRTTEGLRRRVRVALGLLRLAGLLSLLVLASGAFCLLDVSHEEKPPLLVVVDDSASMRLADGEPGGPSRLQRAESALDGGLRQRLGETYQVRVARTSEAGGAAAPPGDGPQDLARSIIRLSAVRRDQPLAHVLVLSDGSQVGYDPLWRAAAEVAAPVSCLSVGDGAILRDVILESVSVPPYAYENDRALVTAKVRSLGVPGEAVLKLALRTGEAAREIATARVTLKPGGDPAIARVEFRTPPAGLRRLSLSVLPAPGELTNRNNAVTFHLDVRGEKIRVLFVEGQPSWEYRFVKRALEADPAVEFHGLVRLPGDEWFYQAAAGAKAGPAALADPRKGFPASSRELDAFDVLILGDLERKALEQGGRFEMIDRFVRTRGGGLCTIGGRKVYSAGNYEGTPLARLVPFQIIPQKKTQLINRFQVVVTTQALMHPLMHIEYDPVANEKAWATLPWVEGGNAVQAVKPGATLLMVHPTLKTRYGPRPVAAAWQIGRGRVFSSALDGTWHWRMARTTETDYHRRFWGLVARHLGGDPRHKKVWGSLVCDRAVLEVGAETRFFVVMRDEQGNAVRDAGAEFKITPPAGQPIVARTGCDAAVPGRYTVPFVPNAPGEYTVGVKLTQGKETRLEQSQKYLVSPSRQELLEVRPDGEAMRRLARESGGSAAALGDHASLALPAPHPVARTEPVVVAVWQSPGVLAVLLVALCVEWLMRKRRGLA